MSKDDKRGRRKTNQPQYSVGKGKPPIETRFQKGVSGNPSGKRKRPKTPWEAMEDLLLNRTCAVMIDGKRQQLPYGEAFLLRLGNEAMQGKPLPTKIMFDLWVACASRSKSYEDDELSPADEELLSSLGIPAARHLAAQMPSGEVRVTIDPDGTMSVEAEEFGEGVVARIEADIAAALAKGEDPIEVIEAFLSDYRPSAPSKNGTFTIREAVTSVLEKGDGTVEVRSS